MRKISSFVCACSLCGSLVLSLPAVASAYQVQPGDSLWSIAQQYGVSLSRLEEANGLNDSSILQIGQHISIPGNGPVSSHHESSPDFHGSYTVQSGDSLWDIAERYGTTVDALMAANGLSSDLLHIGQVLHVPGGSSSHAGTSSHPTAAAASHPAPPEVSRGSSVAAQAAAYALKFRGDPYSFGGISPHGFDCSGFTAYVFSAFAIQLPHSAAAQSEVGRHVPESGLAPGDLVFFNTEGFVSHCGIYEGDGKFISATLSRGVAVESLHDAYWKPRYVGARRL